MRSCTNWCLFRSRSGLKSKERVEGAEELLMDLLLVIEDLHVVDAGEFA